MSEASALHDEILWGSLQVLSLQGMIAAGRAREAALEAEMVELRAAAAATGSAAAAGSFEEESLRIALAARDGEVVALQTKLVRTEGARDAATVRAEAASAERVAAVEEATMLRLLLARCHDALRQEVKWGGEQVAVITGMVQENRGAALAPH